jgi:hypothetical protein
MIADRLAIGAALVGMALMIAALATGANPAEGSVIAPFLTQTVVGNAILGMLIATTFPTMVGAGWTLDVLWPHGMSWLGSFWYPYTIIFQGAIYFGLAKLVSSCVQKARTRSRK